MLDRYKPMNLSLWKGRIDSLENFSAYRWHQWIQPLDLRDDLSAFLPKSGFAFLGFKCDEGIRRNGGRQGASKGPDSIRKELANLPCYFTEDITLFDAGDIFCEDNNLEESQHQLAQAINQILALNLFPIVLGGGHELAYGHYNGILKSVKKEKKYPKIGIFNFDAHFDLRPYPDGGSSGTMFKQIADENAKANLPFSYFCAGLQKHSNTIQLFKTADALGTDYLLASEMIQDDHWHIVEKVEGFINRNEYLYLTVCSDVFSTAFAPGVSAAQPLGIDPELAIKVIKLLLRSGKVLSFDIAEISPRFDLDHTTASLARVIIFSLVNTLCESWQKIQWHTY